MKIDDYRRLGVTCKQFENIVVVYFDSVSFADIGMHVTEPTLEEGIILNIMRGDPNLLCFGRVCDDNTVIIDGFRGWIYDSTRDLLKSRIDLLTEMYSNNYFFATIKYNDENYITPA